MTRMTWPDSYQRGINESEWYSYPTTDNIIAVVTERKRLANAYPESSVEIKKMPQSDLTSNNATRYYYIVLKLTDADEAFFIMQELNS